MRKQFTLEAYRVTKFERLETRNGELVKIYDTELRSSGCDSNYPIVGKVVRESGFETIETWRTNGQASIHEVNANDLFIVYPDRYKVEMMSCTGNKWNIMNNTRPAGPAAAVLREDVTRSKAEAIAKIMNEDDAPTTYMGYEL